MNNQVIYQESDTGLNSFFVKIYSLVGMGIGLSAFVSYLMLFPFKANFLNILTNHPMWYWGASILELVLVFTVSGVARRNTPAALPLFLVYSALNGFTLSFIVAAYAQTTVLQAFLSAMAVFFVMAMIGAKTKKDLSGMSKALFAALIGIIIAMLINFFFKSNAMSYMISIASVLIFSGLIASDNQLIKRVYTGTNGQVSDGWAVSLSLSLYLDFINIFISLLRLFGRND
ncbi:Bax inhibitor-1/YccA family protein [Streptococcus halichoeri]|uniref:Bax inhibitor-1/YccA family protein n=1 Tax=Streptococcus halichoeri TaxID=254785 RepID=UPI001357AC84|nr:Bax inhibitor-1/YccA family protein [Streptococcus halichoeri]